MIKQSLARAFAGRIPIFCCALLYLLSACGGGGDGGGNTNNPPPPPPPPPPPVTTYSVGGAVSGLAGSGLVLRNNGGDDFAATADGGFTFATEVTSGSAYSVTVAVQPASPAQTCSVSNGTGTANADVSNVAVACVTNSSSVDTDGDGLTDNEELSQYGTSPVLADTDGDGYSDFDELITNGFDPSVNNLVFNPRVADVPIVNIRIQETPIIGWNYVEGSAQGSTTSTSRSQSTTNSTSLSFGASTTVGVEATTSATAGVSATGPSAEVSQSVSVSASATVSFDTTNTQENQSAWEEMQANNIETTRDTSSGFMRLGVTIENGGHLTFRIESLTLASTRTTEGNEPFIATGSLNLDGSQSFPATTISQGNQTPPLTFERNDIDLGSVRSLLTDTRSIQVEPLFEIVDRNGLPFPFREEDIANNTAKIVIDYGPYRESELLLVATNITPGAPGQTLEALLDDFVAVPTVSDSSGLVSVRNTQSPSGRWVVTRNRKRDTETETMTFDATQAAYDLAGIDVRARDEVLLVLLEDPDGDNIGYREELVHGTDPNDADSDNDGLSDFDEIRLSWTVSAVNQNDTQRYPSEVFPSPTSADYDGDGLNDIAERDRGLDPYNADTDGDGLRDDIDIDNGNLALVNNSVLSIGRVPGSASDTEFTLALDGSVVARSPAVPANVDIDWRSDGGDVTSFQTLPGGDPSLNIGSRFNYAGAGQYTVSLDAEDDSSPANTLLETATVVFTDPGLSANQYARENGWVTQRHVRKVIDINEDGFADVVGLSNSNTSVKLGSTAGLGAPVQWSSGNWHYGIYNNVDTEPRMFADIDAQAGLEIIGVDQTPSGVVVRYGINNGTGFDDPVDWIVGLPWTSDRDNAFIADVDNNGFADFIHASSSDRAVQAYTNNGGSLLVTARAAVSLPAGEVIDRRLYPIVISDIDDDSCADIVFFGSSDTWFARSSCDGEFADFVVLTGNFGRVDDGGWSVDRHKRWIDDVTNDGLPDIVAIGEYDVFVMVNQTASGNVAFGNVQVFGDDFIADEGWADDKTVSGVRYLNIHPRYLADVNADGYKDLVGFAGAGAAIGINRLGTDGIAGFTPVRLIASDFNVGATDSSSRNRWWSDAGASCELVSPCREYFPRMVGDVDGDNRADLIGFEIRGTVFQPMPYVTQFE